MRPIRMIVRLRLIAIVAFFSLAPVLPIAAEPVTVRHLEGLIHGFVTLRELNGTLLATGDLTQVSNGNRVTNEFVLHFTNGSVHEETTVFSQQKVFKLVSYHLVQRGAAFKIPLDMTLDAATGQCTVKYTENGKDKIASERLKLPPDVANGVITTLLNDIDPKQANFTVAMVAATPKPRLVKLAVSPEGDDTFSIAGSPRQAKRYVVKVQIGGLGGVVAPLVGRQPPDTHVWMIGGKAPSFLKSEGPLFDGGPVWRIELASPVWTKEPVK